MIWSLSWQVENFLFGMKAVHWIPWYTSHDLYRLIITTTKAYDFLIYYGHDIKNNAWPCTIFYEIIWSTLCYVTWLLHFIFSNLSCYHFVFIYFPYMQYISSIDSIHSCDYIVLYKSRCSFIWLWLIHNSYQLYTVWWVLIVRGHAIMLLLCHYLGFVI